MFNKTHLRLYFALTMCVALPQSISERIKAKLFFLVLRQCEEMHVLKDIIDCNYTLQLSTMCWWD